MIEQILTTIIIVAVTAVLTVLVIKSIWKRIDKEVAESEARAKLEMERASKLLKRTKLVTLNPENPLTKGKTIRPDGSSE